MKMRPAFRRLGWRQWLPYSFVVAGLATLIYVSAQYGNMYWQQRQLERAWAQENSAVQGQGEVRPVHDGLTRILIPKIKLDAVVVEGTGRKQLLIGPGRLKESAQPGVTGNTVITAHRDTFFRHIYELNKGDAIELRRNGALYRYQVTGKRVVDPSDVSVLDPTSDAQLTLITCYPTYYIGPAPERLVVFSKLVESTEERRAAAQAHGNP